MNDADYILHPKQEPEVVVLKDQTIQDVERIIKESEAANKKAHEELDKIIQKQTTVKKPVKLSYENEMVSDYQPPNLYAKKTDLKRDSKTFALWRKLADVQTDSEKVNIEHYSKTQELMDLLLVKLKRELPKLQLGWTECWNPSLTVNDCQTNLTLEKITLAYDGLLNVVEDINAQGILANIVSKKLKTLFI